MYIDFLSCLNSCGQCFVASFFEIIFVPKCMANSQSNRITCVSKYLIFIRFDAYCDCCLSFEFIITVSNLCVSMKVKISVRIRNQTHRVLHISYRVPVDSIFFSFSSYAFYFDGFYLTAAATVQITSVALHNCFNYYYRQK